jgi:hypothetical protein
MATFTRSPQSRLDQVLSVIAECYPDLHDLCDAEKHRFPVTFDLLDVFADQDANGEPKGPAIKHHGRAVHADIRAVSKADRALGRGDVLIRFDGDHWEDMSEADQLALIDHELRHLNPLRTKDEAWKKDDLGRQLFAMHDHDVEVGWFIDVAQRRGEASIEVQQAKRIADKWGQFLFTFGETQPLALKPGRRTRGGRGDVAQGEPMAEEPNDGQVREWRLWEALTGDEQEFVTDRMGEAFDRGAEFRVVLGSVCDQRPITDAAPANEQEAPAPKKSRAGKAAAAKKGGKK